MKHNLKFTLILLSSMWILASCSGGTKTTETTAPADGAATSQAAAPAAAQDYTGTYEMTNQVEEGTLKVAQTGNTIRFALSVHIGNAAEIEFNGDLTKVADKSYTHNKDGCKLDFDYVEEEGIMPGWQLSTLDTPYGCGMNAEGKGIDVSGFYHKTSSEKPTF